MAYAGAEDPDSSSGKFPRLTGKKDRPALGHWERKMILSIILGVLKNKLKKAIGITALNSQIATIQVQLGEFKEILYGEDLLERAKRRWRNSEPENGLTWGKEISGDPFITKLQRYVTFDQSIHILEIGPGYGRMLKSILAMKLDFKKYTGLDISEKNIGFLKKFCSDEAVEFVHGDAESFSTGEKFDLIFSSLTFKHLFPTFETALKNLARCLAPGGIIAFDLIEGDRRMFESDQVTYLHFYSKKAVMEILEKVPLELVAFDRVEHMPNFVRLLVVAWKA